MDGETGGAFTPCETVTSSASMEIYREVARKAKNRNYLIMIQLYHSHIHTPKQSKSASQQEILTSIFTAALLNITEIYET